MEIDDKDSSLGRSHDSTDVTKFLESAGRSSTRSDILKSLIAESSKIVPNNCMSASMESDLRDESRLAIYKESLRFLKFLVTLRQKRQVVVSWHSRAFRIRSFLLLIDSVQHYKHLRQELMAIATFGTSHYKKTKTSHGLAALICWLVKRRGQEMTFRTLNKQLNLKKLKRWLSTWISIHAYILRLNRGQLSKHYLKENVDRHWSKRLKGIYLTDLISYCSTIYYHKHQLSRSSQYQHKLDYRDAINKLTHRTQLRRKHLTRYKEMQSFHDKLSCRSSLAYWVASTHERIFARSTQAKSAKYIDSIVTRRRQLTLFNLFRIKIARKYRRNSTVSLRSLRPQDLTPSTNMEFANYFETEYLRRKGLMYITSNCQRYHHKHEKLQRGSKHLWRRALHKAISIWNYQRIVHADVVLKYSTIATSFHRRKQAAKFLRLLIQYRASSKESQAKFYAMQDWKMKTKFLYFARRYLKSFRPLMPGKIAKTTFNKFGVSSRKSNNNKPGFQGVAPGIAGQNLRAASTLQGNSLSGLDEEELKTFHHLASNNNRMLEKAEQCNFRSVRRRVLRQFRNWALDRKKFEDICQQAVKFQTFLSFHILHIKICSIKKSRFTSHHQSLMFRFMKQRAFTLLRSSALQRRELVFQGRRFLRFTILSWQATTAMRLDKRWTRDNSVQTYQAMMRVKKMRDTIRRFRLLSCSNYRKQQWQLNLQTSQRMRLKKNFHRLRQMSGYLKAIRSDLQSTYERYTSRQVTFVVQQLSEIVRIKKRLRNSELFGRRKKLLRMLQTIRTNWYYRQCMVVAIEKFNLCDNHRRLFQRLLRRSKIRYQNVFLRKYDKRWYLYRDRSQAVKRKVLEFRQRHMQLRFLFYLRRLARSSLSRKQTNQELDQFCGEKQKRVVMGQLQVAVSCRALELSIAEDMQAFHTSCQYRHCLRLLTLLVMRKWSEKERTRISIENNRQRIYRVFIKQLEANTIYGDKYNN